MPQFPLASIMQFLNQMQTWWNLRPRWQIALLCITVLSLWGVIDVMRRARVSDVDPFVHKTDVTVYTGAGAAMFDGRDPYEVSSPRGWHYLYPPLFAIAIAPLSKLATTDQALVWYALSCLTVWGSIYETRRLWRWSMNGRDADQATKQLESSALLANQSPMQLISVCATAALALPVMNTLQRGQVGVLLIYLLLLGARLVLTSSSRAIILLGGIVLALPVAIKLTPILPAAVLCGGLLVGELIFRKRLATRTDIETDSQQTAPLRGVFSCCGGLVGLSLWILFVPALAVGWKTNMRHLDTWVARVVSNDQIGQDNDFNARSKRNQSFANGVRRLGNFALYSFGVGPYDQLVDDLANGNEVMPMESRAVKLALLAFVAGLLGLMAWQVIRHSAQPTASGVLAIFGLACTATLVVSPISWGHHFVMCWPALIFVPGSMTDGRNVLAARRFAIGATVLLVGHYIALDITGRVGFLGIGMTLWCAAAVWLLTPRRTRAEQKLPVTPDKESIVSASQKFAA